MPPKLLNTLLVALFVVTLIGGVLMIPAEAQTGRRTLVLSEKNTINLNLPIEGELSRDVQLELMAKGNLLMAPDLYLFLNSPGGSIMDGLEIVTTARGLRSKVHTVSMFSASMSFVISQYLDKRFALPNATLMSHRAQLSGGLSGEIPGNLLSRLFNLTNLLSQQDNQVAARAGIDVNEYIEMIRDELWLSADQARQHNFIDEVVNVRCDESLSGTKSQTIQVAIFTVTVEFSKCPLVTYPVSIHVGAKYAGRDSAAHTKEQIDTAARRVYSAVDLYFRDKTQFMSEYGSFNSIARGY